MDIHNDIVECVGVDRQLRLLQYAPSKTQLFHQIMIPCAAQVVAEAEQYALQIQETEAAAQAQQYADAAAQQEGEAGQEYYADQAAVAEESVSYAQ